jgi:NAD(P)-dependent dehydrogenase (short-subunit alcohol dehydrogenase family)
MSTLLENRVAIVTGGGQAMGKTIALRLARAGADVVVIGPIGPDLVETAQEIQALGRRSLAKVTDVSNEEQVNAAAERVLREFRRVDVLVNNAAVIGPTAPAVNISRAEWDHVLAVNLTGAFLCAKAVLPDMIARRSGKIINISSVAGRMAYALRSPYAVSKWGMIGLTRTLAQELGEHHIQVNAVLPGPIAGERMRQVIERRAQESGQSVEEVERGFVQATALKRMVQPDDVAAMVVFLASDDANNITGQAIEVTAGYAL